MTPRDSSPGGSSFASPLSFIQPRHRNKSTYVQRYKVLRERNKSLPKLDFNAKASGMPKKFQGPGSFSRSYTYDSMKLPSISTCSIVTGMSGKTVHSDGYRRVDLTDKKNLQDQHSSSYTDLNTRQDYRDLTATMSKSLQNLASEESSQKQENIKTKADNSQKYESISYKKHLLKRHKTNDASTSDTNKRSKGAPAKFKLEKDSMKELVEKEFVFVKNNTRMSPLISDKQEKTQDSVKKNTKKFGCNLTNQSPPLTDDVTNRSDTATVTTTDDVTIHSAFTHTSYKSNSTNHQYPINMSAPLTNLTI
ncbi:uncharacterized protein LOC132753634 isoform X2 [Ruditapes philippinarum]|uniref:uncharacterized protein LOC132753634 isoform X2 n=1 Tax=Ruditapes philippinarum TaxID=129788 RepID=UPI00295BF9B2|nr:uncharacterized protein LOC132753634 isoform X2 [Ruditapes philippinarum]